MNKMYIKDSKGNPSLTTTVFVIGFIVVCVKLMISGITYKDFSIPVFSGVEFAAAIGSLGSIYVLRRKGEKEEKQND